MVRITKILHYLWIIVSFLYLIGKRISFGTWFYLFVTSVALIGIYFIMHIISDLWKTIGTIIMFVPKLLMTLINCLLKSVDAPHCHMIDHEHHMHQSHRHGHHDRTITPPQTETESSDRWILNNKYSFGIRKLSRTLNNPRIPLSLQLRQ